MDDPFFCELGFYVGVLPIAGVIRPGTTTPPRGKDIELTLVTTIPNYHQVPMLQRSVSYFGFGFPAKKIVLVCEHSGTGNYNTAITGLTIRLGRDLVICMH